VQVSTRSRALPDWPAQRLVEGGGMASAPLVIVPFPPPRMGERAAGVGGDVPAVWDAGHRMVKIRGFVANFERSNLSTAKYRGLR
jgi:hypothetical protein